MINRFLRKIKYWYKSDNESFIKYLRKKGITIGNNVHFYGCDQAHIDLQYPFLIGRRYRPCHTGIQTYQTDHQTGLYGPPLFDYNGTQSGPIT